MRSRRPAVLGLLVLLIAVVAGCGGGSPSSDGGVTSTTAHIDTYTSTSIVPGAATDGYAGARADVSTVACDRSGSSWTASGTVTNPTTTAADYRIYVSFTDATNRALAVVETDVRNVSAGRSGDWRVTAPVPMDGLQCILRVERTPRAGR